MSIFKLTGLIWTEKKGREVALWPAPSGTSLDTERLGL